MKESITKFDLESAFKALDEIEIPKAGKVRANKPALTEIFSRKSKFDALMEEYYDICSSEGLEDAKEAREAEVAQAKLARIEKIVDLDAESAEDLLTSYVGKYIIQCPQCLTLFYKNPEDVVASEEDPTTVNLNEICQHCGNESGYSLIGKVGEAEPEVEEAPAVEEDELDLNLDDEGAAEEGEEAPVDDLNFDDELEELDLDIEEEPAEEEKKEESFNVGGGQHLTEALEEADFDKVIKQITADLLAEIKPTPVVEVGEYYGDFKDIYVSWEQWDETNYRKAKDFFEAKQVVDAWVLKNAKKYPGFNLNRLDEINRFGDYFITINVYADEKNNAKALTEELADDKELDAKLEAHNEYIEYLRNMITQEEAALEKTENAQVKDAIQRRIDAFKADLESALPEAVKNDTAVEESIEETEDTEVEAAAEVTGETEDAGETEEAEKTEEAEEVNESLTEALHEDADVPEVSDAEFEQLMNSSEFKKPISDTAVRAMLAAEDEESPKKEENLDNVFNDVEELQENTLESMISDSLVELYGNVAGFRLKDCSYEDSKFMVEGVIHFTSGNTRKTTYTFNEALIEADKVTLCGLNEKLGNDKQFFITGYTENKTFITESFKTAKN